MRWRWTSSCVINWTVIAIDNCPSVLKFEKHLTDFSFIYPFRLLHLCLDLVEITYDTIAPREIL